jgi:hypothetical protein
MRNDKLIPGLILVMIGIVILLDNLGYIDFYWDSAWHLWPLVLIIAGISLVFGHARSAFATVIKVVVIIGVFVFVMVRYGGLGPRIGIHDKYSYWRHDRDHDNDDSDDNNDDNGNNNSDDDNDTSDSRGIVKVEGNSNFNLPYTADAKYAELNINGGGSEYVLNDTTNQFFKADTKERWGKYEFWHHNDGQNYVLNFEMNGKHGIHLDMHGDNHDDANQAVIKLNPNPIWDVNVETGASSVNFDLSKFKIRNVKINGGAASFDVKLGQPLETTSVHVSTGAASVNMSIPKNAACKVSISGFLSSDNLTDSGFQKIDNGDYETPGFDAAKNKIYMDVSGGMASFSVKRY